MSHKNVHIMALLADYMLDVKIGTAGSMPRSLIRTAGLQFNLRRNKGTWEQQSSLLLLEFSPTFRNK